MISRNWIALPCICLFALALSSSLPGADDHDHGHPTAGPHGGSLVELGDEEYHAEFLLKDKTHEVVVHILDSSAKKVVPIREPELLLNLKSAGKPKQYKLAATPEKTDPKGSSSRFVLKDEKLVHILHEKNAAPQMRVKINDRSYNGKINVAHHHDHDHKH